MNYREFKLQVAAYMNREAASFKKGTLDLLDRAINMARRHAEREHNFELARCSVKVTVNLTSGGTLDSAVDFDDEETLVEVKRIERAFLPVSNGAYAPIELAGRGKHMERLKRSFSGAQSLVEMIGLSVWVPNFSLSQQGGKIYLHPSGSSLYNGATAVEVALDVVRFLPPYASDDDEDFLLTNAEDWLLFRSIFELNFFLKEDERVPVSARALQEAWESVVKWDAQIVNGAVDDTTLE